MKDAYFPGWWNIHTGRLSKNSSRNASGQTEFYASGRALYGDWGRYGGVSLDENLNTCLQFNLENPLSYKLDAFYYKQQNDTLFAEKCSHHFLEKRKESVSAFIYFRNVVEQTSSKLKRRYTTEMENFTDAVECGNKSRKVLLKKSDFTPISFKYLVDKKSDLIIESSAADLTMLSSPIYSGGCIKVVNFKATTYVIFCDGLNMSQLTVSKLNSISNSLENTEIYRYEIGKKNEMIFQVESVVYGEYINVLVRFMESICLLKINESHNGLTICIVGMVNSMDQYISCKLDNNWSREFAGTFPDKFELYDSTINRSIWCKDDRSYSTVIDKWNEVQSTNFPKVWIYTNRSNSYLYDTRINPFSPELELMNTKLDSFSKSESFYHATEIFQDNYYYLFSGLSGILVDIRSPFIAVSQWTVPSMSPCSYSSINTLSHIDKVNFTVGSQLDAKHIIFQQHIDNNSKSTALSSKSNLVDQSIMSLGVASHFNRDTDELSVLTLDQLGNIIGNQYKLNNDLHNYHSVSKKTQAYSRLTKRFKLMENFQSEIPRDNLQEFLPKKTVNKKSIDTLGRIFQIQTFKCDTEEEL